MTCPHGEDNFSQNTPASPASQTSRAAPAFMTAIPRPTRSKSGHADGHRKAVTSPATSREEGRTREAVPAHPIAGEHIGACQPAPAVPYSIRAPPASRAPSGPKALHRRRSRCRSRDEAPLGGVFSRICFFRTPKLALPQGTGLHHHEENGNQNQHVNRRGDHAADNRRRNRFHHVRSHAGFP
jgi:hypothetical protein